MKTLMIITFILLIFICIFFWYRERKQLTKEQKTFDLDITAKQDLLGLCILLCGYMVLYFYPHRITLLYYVLIVVLINIIMQIHYYLKLKRLEFPYVYRKAAVFYSTVIYLSTTVIGMFFILMM